MVFLDYNPCNLLSSSGVGRILPLPPSNAAPASRASFHGRGITAASLLIAEALNRLPFLSLHKLT